MMDDSCIVCAEALEWVAYGPCGHREVCSTCVARLRFVCLDRRCCLCQSKQTAIFITKALGEFTRVITNFSAFPDEATEGKVGSFWYFEDVQAFFDDLEHYRKIKAMCRLSCIVCDKSDGNGEEVAKKRKKFRTIEQLCAHTADRHKLSMCSLCLKGRKVFICEQKLYNCKQLEQHIQNGDTNVDGDESEGSGFSGHPLCKFCNQNFYGDNELYTHMSRDHYTCHICQRQSPGMNQYYKDYDDLENHFRKSHLLCEDNSCLEKKFVVFASQAEMKRHHAIEHGENMSRSERSSALRINTCFWHPQRNDENFYRRVSLIDSANVGSGQGNASSQGPLVSDDGMSRRIGSNVHSSASMSADYENSSEHSQTSNPILEESSFPPLPSSSNRRRRRKSKNTNVGTSDGNTTMASLLRRRYDGSLIALNAAPARTTPYHQACLPLLNRISSSHSLSTLNQGAIPLSDSSPSSQGSSLSTSPNLSFSASTHRGGPSTSFSKSSTTFHETGTSGSSSSAKKIVDTDRKKEAHALSDSVREVSTNSLAANKSLIEKIWAELEFDKDKFAAFKLVSKEYREGLIDLREYLAYVQQFGLAHLVHDLATLCPNPEKQRELLGAHSYGSNGVAQNRTTKSNPSKRSDKGSKKGKEKCVELGSSSLEDGLNAGNDSRKGKGKSVDNGKLALKDARSLQTIACGSKEVKSSGKPVKECPSRNERGECGEKPIHAEYDGDPKTSLEIGSKEGPSSNGGGSGDGDTGVKKGGKKKPKKMPKFLRDRLGESASTNDISGTLDEQIPGVKSYRKGKWTGVSTGGAWQNGDSSRLVVAMARSRPA